MSHLRTVTLYLVVLLAGACASQQQSVPVYYVAEAAMRRGDFTEAADNYQHFVNHPRHEEEPYLPRSYYMLALAHHRLGQHEAALTALDELEDKYPRENWVQVWALRGDIHRDLGQRVNAVQDWDSGWRVAGPMDRLRLERRVTRTLGEMTPDEVAKAEQMVFEPALHELISKRVVESGGGLIPEEETASTMEFGEDMPPVHAVGAPGSGQVARLEEPEDYSPPAVADARPRVGRVACLAPLAGPEGAAGRRVADAVRLAFGDAASRVSEYDAGYTAESARVAWTQVMADPSVLAIVASLPSPADETIASLAERVGVPTIILSGHGDLNGRYVRQWGTPVPGELSSLIEYMNSTVRIRRFGILYPETPEGTAYLNAFRREVERHGAMLVAKGSYRAGYADWSAEVAQLKKWRSRDVNVEAIFLPDLPPRVVQLATAVNTKYPDLILLGLGDWQIPGSPAPELRAFVAGPPPAPAESEDVNGQGGGADPLAYEAGVTLYSAVVDADAHSRSEVRARLSAAPPPTTRATTAGASILRYHDGAIEQVGAPQG